jgi:hypothetical protein
VSVKVMSAVWEHVPADGSLLLLLLALADFADDGGQSWPSVRTLAHRVRLSPRRTFELLHDAEERGLIARESGGGNRSNRYRITIPTPAEDRTGATGRTPAEDRTPTPATGRTGPLRRAAPEPSVEPSMEPSPSADATRTDTGEEFPWTATDDPLMDMAIASRNGGAVSPAFVRQIKRWAEGYGEVELAREVLAAMGRREPDPWAAAVNRLGARERGKPSRPANAPKDRHAAGYLGAAVQADEPAEVAPR